MVHTGSCSAFASEELADSCRGSVMATCVHDLFTVDAATDITSGLDQAELFVTGIEACIQVSKQWTFVACCDCYEIPSSCT